MMDLGATVCTRTQPSCNACPLQKPCIAYQTDCVTSLPTSKPRKTKPQRARYLLLLKNENQHVLLQQRPPTGIWGGLWSLPECPINEDIPTWCHKHVGFKVKHLRKLPLIYHSFSHYDLMIHPVMATLQSNTTLMDPADSTWYDGSVLPGGLPAPVKTLLDQIFVEEAIS